MIIFYSLGVFILLLVRVHHSVQQQERGGSVLLPGLIRVAGEEGKEAWDQKGRDFKDDEGLDNKFLGTSV